MCRSGQPGGPYPVLAWTGSVAGARTRGPRAGRQIIRLPVPFTVHRYWLQGWHWESPVTTGPTETRRALVLEPET